MQLQEIQSLKDLDEFLNSIAVLVKKYKDVGRFVATDLKKETFDINGVDAKDVKETIVNSQAILEILFRDQLKDVINNYLKGAR